MLEYGRKENNEFEEGTNESILSLTPSQFGRYESMDTQNKIHFSNILRQELHAIKVQLWAIEVEKIPNDQKLPLEFDQKLETHWDTLFSSLPQIESLFLGPTILDRQVDLIQWINKLSTYF